jgi:hypothetical protein
MILLEIVRTVGIAALSGIGGAAVLWRFATDSWIERRKARWNKELEAFKDGLTAEQRRLQAQLDSALFVTRSHFEVEFNAMREVHRCLAEVKLAFRTLHPISSKAEKLGQERDQLIDRFGMVTEAYWAKVEEWAAFLDPQLYTYFERAYYGADEEYKRLRTETGSAGAQLNTEQFLGNYQRACQETRDRLKRLVVQH